MVLKFNIYIFVFLFLLLWSDAQQYRSLKDGDVATISLLNYNISDPDGESVEFVYTLLPNTTAKVSVTNIPGDVFFVVVQAHSHLHNITLSYGALPTEKTSVNGTNIGLWNTVSSSKVSVFISYMGDESNTTLMLAAQAYGHQAPIPGGCNMEQPIETAPYLVTRYDNSTIVVEFSPAAPPMSVLAWLGIESDSSCNMKVPAVEHDVYRLHLYEQDFSPDSYLTALQRLMTIGRIKQWAHEINAKAASPPLRRTFAAYPGTGSAVVVVARTLSSVAVYVPSFTYACDARQDDDTCAVLLTTFSKILCASILFLGLFACFFAHRFFNLETLLLGLFAGGLLIYILMSNISESSETLSVAVGGGLAIGCALVLSWCCCSLPLFSVSIAAACLGYLIAASFFFATLDFIDAFSADINYWIPFCCIILVAIILMTPLAEKANVLATSVLGAYAAIIPIDYYLGSNLRFILVNSIRRATVPGFGLTIIDPPIQGTDLVLCVVWFLLALFGFICQTLLIRNKPPFPAPTHTFRRIYKRIRGPIAPCERSPLLSNAYVRHETT